MPTAAGARRGWPIWAVAIPIAIWVPIRLLGLERGFLLVPLISYTPYVALAALLVTGLAAALRNWAATAMTAVAAACLAAAVLPRTVGSEAAAVEGRQELAVLSANIHRGTADPEALVELVERFQLDLLTIQELTPRFAQQLRAEGIDRLLPEAKLAVEPEVSGAGFYSRLPLRSLPEPARFSFRMPRAAMELPGGRVLRIVGVHPYPPVDRRLDEWRAALESLPSTGSRVPWVLAGDFNATLDHAELRDVLARGYRDAGDATGNGLTPTWPAGSIFPPPVTIDHVLADRRIDILDYAVEDIPGSDHRAVYARLSLP